jgi:hypothetical protein
LISPLQQRKNHKRLRDENNKALTRELLVTRPTVPVAKSAPQGGVVLAFRKEETNEASTSSTSTDPSGSTKVNS